MTLQELEKEVPKLLDYTKTMPEELRRLSHVKIHPPGSLIHQKDYALNYLGIVAKGENRVINEFENGKIYKRLYNCSTGNWEGDWIYLGEYPG